ncbi:retrovirus-related Pol polyprotein from transposon 297 [Trichonephila clavipes]|uniref:RNA-directed DNA polymerase n=1 Tax=Trichonephila clavipes TaxID=2585209 RepID=A0A8X6T0F5_TRICX|nr:retrovirus-related Pol polyprotein from transposon 297 [Trichonephila clavipes]
MDRLRELLSKYSKCFSNNPGLTNLVEHEIQLVSDQPVRTKPYRMSHRQNEILKNEINRMLKLGIIEVGESDYMSPMILVEVAGKEPRPCIDYRKLNGIIRTEYFPLPNIEERVEKVSAAKFITVLDLSKGYWQIPLSKTAQRYAAFCTSFGTYRPLRMSFGLKNAPYFFSKLMAELLNGLEDFVVPYLDDIAIFSDTWESHIKHMETVLQRIKRAKLTIKPSKCKFAQQNVKFLGHIVGQGFRTPSEIKVQAVLEFPTPCTKTQIRAFLGIAGYYQKYINLFSVIAAPLTDALKGRAKKGEIKWTTECENAFRELKGKLIDKPVLYAPNFEREFIVQTDASNAGMGAVLTQLTEQGEEHPILYLSKKFSEVEKRYCTTEKECASIVFAIKRLHYYLDGNSFLVMTDHNPLVWLNRNVSSNPRFMRWALALQPYNFRIVHRQSRRETGIPSNSRRNPISKERIPEKKIVDTKEDRTPVSCYGCGAPGIIRSRCHTCNPVQQKDDALSSSLNQSNFYSFSSERNPISIIQISICNTEAAVCADTSATHSVAGEKLYHLLKQKGLNFEEKTMQITLADGRTQTTEILTTSVDIRIVLDLQRKQWYFTETSHRKYNFVKAPPNINALLTVDPEPHVCQFRKNEGTHLSLPQREEINSLLEKYEECFQPGGEPTPFIEHRINTRNHLPVAVPPYRMNPSKKEILKQEIDRLLSEGIIKECESPYASPVVLIQKPNGTFRICIKYRKLNEITVADTYPLPRMYDLLHQAKLTPFMSTLDLRAGYDQVKVHVEDQDKTAFVCPFGTYRFL